MGKKVAEVVTQRIMESLEAGVAPWKKSWVGGESSKNLISGRPYSGVNFFLTHPMVTGFSQPGFVTYKQAVSLGGNVRKGEKGTPIVFYGANKDKSTGKEYMFARYYRVFNVSQLDGIEISSKVSRETDEVVKNMTAEELVGGWCDAPGIRWSDNCMPHYNFREDAVYMPHGEAFHGDDEYYSTLFHELVHSTGHKSRLNRKFDEGTMTEHRYSKEELVAEIGSAFLCHHVGIEGVLDNQAAYCQGWLKKLNNDRSLILVAAREATKAFEMIIKTGEQE